MKFLSCLVYINFAAQAQYSVWEDDTGYEGYAPALIHAAEVLVGEMTKDEIAGSSGSSEPTIIINEVNDSDRIVIEVPLKRAKHNEETTKPIIAPTAKLTLPIPSLKSSTNIQTANENHPPEMNNLSRSAHNSDDGNTHNGSKNESYGIQIPMVEGKKSEKGENETLVEKLREAANKSNDDGVVFSNFDENNSSDDDTSEGWLPLIWNWLLGFFTKDATEAENSTNDA